ncbi:hypothetical protein [Aeromonas hydrophila]|uniref:hypothetical protein n=1 Tax=Aeromonas hydrophila TaxID=644 RepID=UPI003018BFDA
MKILYKTRKLILPLSVIFSFPVLSAENCTPEQIFEEKLNNFTPNTEIAAIDNINNVNIEELTQKIPTFEEETEGLKLGVVDIFNLELSALQLKDGIEKGNTQEIVNSSVMLASTFVPTIVDGMVEALALEFDSNPATMAIGASIMLGLNIYNGVEADKTIEQQKQDLSNADKIYKDRALGLRNALSDYRNAVLGNDSAIINIDENKVSDLVLGTLRRQISNTIITLGRDALNQHTLHAQKTSLLKESALKNGYVVSNDISLTLDNFGNFLDAEYSVKDRYIPYEKKLHNLNRANWTYVGMWADIPEEDLQEAIRGGIFTVFSSPFKHFLHDSLKWNQNVYLPILDSTLHKMYASNEEIYKVLKKSVEFQLTNPGFQEGLRIHYNASINKKYAWVKFGSELLENLDLSGEKAVEATLWTARVLLPFIEPFMESRMLEDIYGQLSVESKIAAIVNELIKSNIDIHDRDAAYALIKADASNEDVPSSVLKAINIAYDKTLQDVDSLNLSKDEIKPFNISTETVNKIMNKLHDDVNKGTFEKEVASALDNYARDLLFVNMSEKRNAFDKFYAMAEKISSLQAAYNGHIVLAIRKTTDKIKNKTDEQEVVNALRELGRYLTDNYFAFYDSSDPIVMPNTTQDVSFITFGALPFARNDLQYMLDIINAEIETRLKLVNPKGPLTPGSCHPNDTQCF